MSCKNQNEFSACRDTVKILFISHQSELVGAERSLLLLLENIDRKRFEPIVILPRPGPLEEKIRELNIKIYRVKYPWWIVPKINFLNILLIFSHKPVQELLALLKIIKIIKDERINLVYTNTIVIFSGAISAYITKTPHIWHIREIILKNGDLHFFLSNKILFNFVTNFSNIVIAISQAVANQFLVSSFEKIVIIPNAVDFLNFTQSKKLSNIHEIKSHDWIVAVIGNLRPQKAQDVAIQAIKIIEKQIPNVKLILIGEGDKKYTNCLQLLTQELNLTDKVVFAGFRNDVAQLLPHFKVLLVPSDNEPFGRVTIEAMAAGIPVIGTNNGGTKEIIENGITGYLVSPREPAEIAEKMVELYNNPDLIKQFGNNGKIKALKMYNVEKYVRNIEYIMEKLTDYKIN